MSVELAPTPRLTLSDYAEILAAGTEAAQHYHDPITAMGLARAEQHLFRVGALVDEDGRQFVVNLICLGYQRVVAMRAAIQVETESISVIAPAEGWF